MHIYAYLWPNWLFTRCQALNKFEQINMGRMPSVEDNKVMPAEQSTIDSRLIQVPP
jgi:hypothetical protein